MCRLNRIFTNLALEKFSRISFIFNASIMLLNLVIVIFIFLCLIQGKYQVLLKTEMLNYVNIVFFCILMIIIISFMNIIDIRNIRLKQK